MSDELMPHIDKYIQELMELDKQIKDLVNKRRVVEFKYNALAQAQIVLEVAQAKAEKKEKSGE